MHTEILQGWENIWGVTPLEFHREFGDSSNVITRFNTVYAGLILLGTEQFSTSSSTLLSSEIIFAQSLEGQIIKPEPTSNKAEVSAALGLVCLPRDTRPRFSIFDLLGGQSVLTGAMSKAIGGDDRYIGNPQPLSL